MAFVIAVVQVTAGVLLADVVRELIKKGKWKWVVQEKVVATVRLNT